MPVCYPYRARKLESQSSITECSEPAQIGQDIDRAGLESLQRRIAEALLGHNGRPMIAHENIFQVLRKALEKERFVLILDDLWPGQLVKIFGPQFAAILSSGNTLAPLLLEETLLSMVRCRFPICHIAPDSLGMYAGCGNRSCVVLMSQDEDILKPVCNKIFVIPPLDPHASRAFLCKCANIGEMGSPLLSF